MRSKGNKLHHCKECGKEFLSYYETSKYCSKDCKWKKQGERLSGVNNPNYNHKWTKEMKESGSKIKKAWFKNNEHPRGMLGKRHTKETIEHWKKTKSGKNNSMYGRKHKESTKLLIGKIRKEAIKNGQKPPGLYPRPPRTEEDNKKLSKTMLNLIKNDITFFERAIPKKFKYGGRYYRSKSEIDICKFFDERNIKYQYECKLFILKNDRGEEIRYLPDFYLPKFDIWIESKSKSTSFTKFNIFKKENANSILVTDYNYIEKLSYVISGVKIEI